MSLVIFKEVELEIIEDEIFEFLQTTKEVAKGYYGSSNKDSLVRKAKNNNSDEFAENKHFVYKLDDKNRKVIYWTKKGIVRLGFFIKSERAKKFRDWAEDYIVNPNKSHHHHQILGYKSQLSQKNKRILELENKLENQKLLPHKTFDDKLDDMVNQIDHILKTNPNSFGYMQERVKYLSNYIKHLKSNGTEQQRFMISEIDRYKQQFIDESNKRNLTQHKLDRLKNTIDQYVQVSNQMLKYRYEE